MEYHIAARVEQPASTHALAISPDGALVFTTCFDQKLRAYETSSMRLSKALHLGTAFPHSACTSPDGRLVGSGGKALTLFDTRSWKKTVTLRGHRHEVQDSTFSPDGSRVYTASGNAYTPADWSVRAWDATTGAEIWRWKGPNQVFAVAASPDGAAVAAATSSGNVVMLDAATGSVRWSHDGVGWTYCARFTPTGASLLLSGDAAELSVFDAATGARRALPTGAGARAFALTRDGSTALVGTTRYGTPVGVVALELATGTTRWRSEPLGRLAQGVELSRDDARLYVLMNDPHELVVFDRT